MTLVLPAIMQVHYTTENLPLFKNAVVTIGTFDGVHLGHQQIIKQVKQEAALINGETVLITFHPHPRTVVAGSKQLFLLNTPDEKIALLAALEIDHLVIVAFDETFANQTPEEYVHNFLYEKFHPHTLIIGYDHRFGKNRAGDYHLLEKTGKELGFQVKEISEQLINAITISSTRIRASLLNGDVQTANAYLGYHYFFEGLVVGGNKLGRTLGYPTANIIVNDEKKLVPANGIYVAEADIQNNEEIKLSSKKLLQGMMSIGIRPTINGKERTIEVNLFNFKEDIYGRTLKVFIRSYLRPELKFDSLDALKNQIDNDKEHSLNYFGKQNK